MPRSRGGGGGRPAARPAAPPPRPAAPPQQQTRPASTAAHPPQTQQANAQQGRSPGLFGQMASTAAGVAVGSSIGHAIGGMFGGGYSQEAAPADQQQAGAPHDSYQQTQQASQMCQPQVASFKQCMDQNNGDLTICGWYLDQLKACQQAAAQY